MTRPELIVPELVVNGVAGLLRLPEPSVDCAHIQRVTDFYERRAAKVAEATLDDEIYTKICIMAGVIVCVQPYAPQGYRDANVNFLAALVVAGMAHVDRSQDNRLIQAALMEFSMFRRTGSNAYLWMGSRMEEMARAGTGQLVDFIDELPALLEAVGTQG